MKARCALLRMAAVLMAAVCLSSHAATVTFGWKPNTETDLAGYKFYYGTASGNYGNSVVLGKVSTYTMSNLANGVTYYFALTAFNTNDVESVFSAELQYPNAPVLGVIANRSTAEDTAVSVPLHVTDADSPIASVTLSATSANTTLVPNNSITFSGTGTNRTLQIAPVANRTGTATISVTATDGSLTSAARSFVLTVTAAADPPSISAISDVTTDEDIDTGLIQFTISDPETPITNLTVRATSSNPSLIPTNRIFLAGTTTNRTVQLRPTTNQNGSATITLIASDGALNSSNSFNFTVRSINDPPTFTQIIANRNLMEDQKTQAIPFVVSDVETASAALQVTASSSNPSMVPQSGLVLGITSSNRTVTVSPATNVVGPCTITITASDGQASTPMSFIITYLAVNDTPYVSTPPNLTVNKLNPVPPMPVIISDPETAPSGLAITLTSSNVNLLRATDMVLSGTGTNRTLTLTPIANQVGTSRLGIRVSDGAATNQIYFQFTVTGSNNAPVLTIPAPLAGDPGTAIPVPGIQVTDLDVGTNYLSLTLSAPNGTLALSTSVAGGVTASQVTGNNSAAVTVLASLAALNATFANANGLRYTSRPDFGGTEALVVTVSDRGFSGAGGVKTDSETLSIRLSQPSTLDVWRAGYFTAADLQDPAKEATIWGDLADPDNDGRHNLMEFALGLNPLGSEPHEFALVSQTVNSGGNQYLTLTFNSRLNEPLLQYIPEVSADNATWSATAQRTAATPVNAEFEQVTYQDVVPITSETARFIRLRVVRNSP